MPNIVEVSVGVSRAIPLVEGSVTYTVSAKAVIEAHECPAKIYEDTLAFCQDKIIIEMDRLERGDSPKSSTNPLNEDFIPDFKPIDKDFFNIKPQTKG
jgi:hypothetical protein